MLPSTHKGEDLLEGDYIELGHPLRYYFYSGVLVVVSLVVDQRRPNKKVVGQQIDFVSLLLVFDVGRVIQVALSVLGA